MKNNFNQYTVCENEFDVFSSKFLYNTLKKLSDRKEVVSVALSGGSTPLPILSILKEYKLNWDKFNFFMVDERNVPVSSSSSNYGNIQKVFFKDLDSHSYSMVKDNYSIDECAINYEKLLYSKIPLRKNGYPVFDLILLGIGDDGHTASLFPLTEGLNESKKWVIKNRIPQLNTERITLTYPLILNASKIIILSKGGSKEKILKEIKMGKGDHYPITPIFNSKVDTTCILGIN
ncbi:6-phosphogluconolactonase [Polaribacter sp.]|uniref:6-phosphogluconolactonase n=1 Tax=Polaribacter sp. TaxID=1920175 RepID=UPI0025EED481|nr:6-phosphogluconolactonase [Polaribacter sp.]